MQASWRNVLSVERQRILAVLCLAIGLFAMYRGNLAPPDLVRVNGVLEEVSLASTKRWVGTRHTVCYRLAGYDRAVGIDLGPGAVEEGHPLVLKEGSTYTFHLDPTVRGRPGDCRLNVRIIEQEGKVLYAKPIGASRVVGPVLMVLGALLLLGSFRRKR